MGFIKYVPSNFKLPTHVSKFKLCQQVFVNPGSISFFKSTTPRAIVIGQLKFHEESNKVEKSVKNVLKSEVLKHPPTLSSIFFHKPRCIVGKR